MALIVGCLARCSRKGFDYQMYRGIFVDLSIWQEVVTFSRINEPQVFSPILIPTDLEEICSFLPLSGNILHTKW